MPDLSSSTSAAWNFTTNWFTFSPATLFVLLNIVIGTIFLSSHFTPKRKPPQEDGHRPPLVRAPSLIDRVKSINYSFRRHSTEFHDNGDITETDHPTVVQRDVPLLQRLKSVKLSSFYRSESNPGEPEPESGRVYSVPDERHQVERSKSEQRVTADRTGAERMKRWASEKAVKTEVDVEAEEERERVERRRPETVRLGKTTSFGDDEEGGDGVDAKADDFISKFKQQLKLQRLDSLLRYSDMFK